MAVSELIYNIDMYFKILNKVLLQTGSCDLVDVQRVDQGQGAQLLLNYLNKARLGSYS